MSKNTTLKSVQLVNYRTVGEATLELEDKITILVGQNESGKTNLLSAISHLDADKEYEDRDTKINSTYARQNYRPDLRFVMTLSDDIVKKLRNYSRYFNENNEVLITRTDDKGLFVHTLDKKDEWDCRDAYTNTGEIDLNVFKRNGDKFILKPNYYTTATLDSKKNKEAFDNGKLFKYSDEERDKKISSKVTEIVLESLPDIFLWEFSSEYYIQKDVPINFYTTPDKFRSVINLFELGGIKEKDIASHFTGRDSEYIHNFLGELEKGVTRILNNTWKQRDELKIKLHYKTDSIEILLEEENYKIDPAKRSEGLQWYLTFLINFRSKLQELKDTIILFDQPGDKLHPGGQKDLLERIEELSEHNQIIYTTHTPFMIKRQHPERVRLIERPKDDTSIINKLSRKEIFQDELLRASLGFSLSDVSPIAYRNVILEGLLDRIVLLETIYKLQNFSFEINLNDTSFIPAHGASKILFYANYLKSNGLSVVALFDNDAAGSEALEFNKQKKVLKNPEIMVINQLEGSQTIEDLLPEQIVVDSFNEVMSNVVENYTAITELAIPRMYNLLAECNKNEVEFTEQMKADFSEAITAKYKEYELTQERLSGEMAGLFKLVKDIKKKIEA